MLNNCQRFASGEPSVHEYRRLAIVKYEPIVSKTTRGVALVLEFGGSPVGTRSKQRSTKYSC